jgi:ankyrin repeat protein
MADISVVFTHRDILELVALRLSDNRVLKQLDKDHQFNNYFWKRRCELIYETTFEERGKSTDYKDLYETLKDKSLDDRLIIAATKGYFEFVIKLSLHKETINHENAILAATTNGHTEIVKFLIKTTEHNLIDKTTGWVDNRVLDAWISAFELATKNGHSDIVTLFLDHDNDFLDIEIAFELAVENGHVDIAKLLLERDIDECSDFERETLIEDVIKSGNAEIVKLLLEKGRILPSQLLPKS